MSIFDRTRAIAFVSGNDNPGADNWGYGLVILSAEDETKFKTYCGTGTRHADAKAPTGELAAAMRAVQVAITAGYDSITIYYNHEGVRSWANEIWKTRCECTRQYHDYMLGKRDFIDILFARVRDDANAIKFAEMASRLAAKNCVGVSEQDPGPDPNAQQPL